MEMFLNTVCGFVCLSLVLVLRLVLFLGKECGWRLPALRVTDPLGGGEMRKTHKISAISLLSPPDKRVL